MATIPNRLMHVEVVFEPLELLAHRRGEAGPAPGYKPQPNRHGQVFRVIGTPADRYSPRCRPAETPTLQAMSAFRADEFEAEACDAEACFGPDLAAPSPAFVHRAARLPGTGKSAKRTRRLAAVK